MAGVDKSQGKYKRIFPVVVENHPYFSPNSPITS